MKVDQKAEEYQGSKEKEEFPKKRTIIPKPKRDFSPLPLSVNPLFRLAHNSLF